MVELLTSIVRTHDLVFARSAATSAAGTGRGRKNYGASMECRASGSGDTNTIRGFGSRASGGPQGACACPCCISAPRIIGLSAEAIDETLDSATERLVQIASDFRDRQIEIPLPPYPFFT